MIKIATIRVQKPNVTKINCHNFKAEYGRYQVLLTFPPPCFDLQVYPATLRLASCDKPLEGGNKIIIEPTIPVRRNPTRPAGHEDLTVTFALPSGLTLKDGVCKLTLSDLNRLEVEVVPTCPLQDDGKTRVIIVEINSNGVFWLGTLRSIWASISLSKLFKIERVVPVVVCIILYDMYEITYKLR